MSMACDVFAGQLGRSAARKSDAKSLAPVTLATPSMRPTPVAAGFQPCRPGSVSRAAKFGSPAIAKGVMLSAMPLAVADLTKSRREILIGRQGIARQHEAAALRDFSPAYVRFGSFTSFPPSRRIRFARKSRPSASARVYEYAA